MGVTVTWFDADQTTIIYQFNGTWTWADYDQARKDCRSMLDIVDYGIDQIYDFSKAPVPPSGIVTKFWQVAVTKHQNTSGLIVVVGDNKLVQMLTNAVGTLVGKAVRNFDISYISDLNQIDAHLQKRRLVHRKV